MSDKKKRGRPPTERAIKYREILAKHPGLSLKKAKMLAGYSAGTNTSSLSQKTAQMQTIDQRRERALEKLGITFESQFTTLKEIQDSKMEHASDRIRAVHEVNLMTPGFLAPERRQVESKSLFVELSGMTSEALGELAQLLGEAVDSGIKVGEYEETVA